MKEVNSESEAFDHTHTGTLTLPPPPSFNWQILSLRYPRQGRVCELTGQPQGALAGSLCSRLPDQNGAYVPIVRFEFDCWFSFSRRCQCTTLEVVSWSESITEPLRLACDRCIISCNDANCSRLCCDSVLLVPSFGCKRQPRDRREATSSPQRQS